MQRDLPIYDIWSLSQFNQEDILISRFAPYLAIHKNLHLPHKHTFYHLLCFTKGGGTHAIDFQQFPVRPYQIYFMIPGQVHSWSFAGEVDGFVINFSASFFRSLLLQPDYLEQFPFFGGNVSDSVIDIPESHQAKVHQLFEQLIDESDASGRLALDMVRALLLQLFILIGRLLLSQPHRNSTPHSFTLVKKFQKLIESHYSTLKLPKLYADLLFITPNHLNAVCNDVLGISAGEVIRDYIALEAKRLLINKSMTISEIAGSLNFADNSYFTKFFKKQTGQTPEEFRKDLLIQHSSILR
jgi:AraC family transcriptional regulator, transcriptional activator of pobA